MAVCDYCEQDMLDKVGCTLSVFDDFADGVTRRRIKFRGRANYRLCGDCGVPSNSFHHPGCDMERCPSCERQAMSCGCVKDEDEDDDLEWQAS